MSRTALEKLVIRRRAAGVSQSEIAREVGLSRQRISQVCKGLGISTPPPPPREERLAKLPDLMRQGLSIENIAERLQVSFHCARCDIQRLPDRLELEQARAGARPATARRRQIKHLIEEGMALPEVASSLDVDIKLIRRDMKRDPELRQLRVRAKANRKGSEVGLQSRK